jgi:hypothetical protein
MRYFSFSFVIAVIGLSLAFMIGEWSAVYLTSILAVLEISLSFDNAVVNAKILKSMDKIWERRFLTWGMIIAVFGMRFVFPILIVAVASNMGILQTLNIAIHDPARYHEVLLKSEDLIYAFGGAFLWLVFTDFLFEKKEVRWIKPVERYAEKLGRVNNISLIVATIIGIVILYDSKSYEIGIAYLLGMLTFSLLNGINDAFAVQGAKNGLMGFIYLEILDASFSFDGVIGAFAITGNIFLIMIGLGVGAMFVRSLTIWMVEKGVLNEYKYLEHGAHYAIGVLAVIMLLKIFMHIGEVLTGTIGLGLLIVAFLHSKLEKRN